MAKRKKAGPKAAGKAHAPLKGAQVRRLLELEPNLVKVLERLDLRLTTGGQLVKPVGMPLGPICSATAKLPFGPRCAAAAKALLVAPARKKSATAKGKAGKGAKR